MAGVAGGVLGGSVGDKREIIDVRDVVVRGFGTLLARAFGVVER
jgi:hypothetical protein